MNTTIPTIENNTESIAQLIDNADDQTLFKLFEEELYTPVVGDILDIHQYTHQFFKPQTKPVHLAIKKVIGRAMPMIYVDVSGPQDKPFGLLTEALDQTQAGDVLVVGGGSKSYAVWGEILTATVKIRGARGAVIDGWHRDTPRVIEQDWPVFSYGSYAQDAGVRGSVTDYRCQIEINGTKIQPGDLIFGDIDGVLAIPQTIEKQIIKEALEKARGEKVVRKAIENGLSSTEAFKKYGIL